MPNITRRELCKVAGISAIVLAASPLTGCAGGDGGPAVSGTASEAPNPTPSETAPEEGYPNGTPSSLFGAPGKHAWFYGSAPSKNSMPDLLVFEDGTVTLYESQFLLWLPKEERFDIADLVDLTDEEIIARYDEAIQRAYNSIEIGTDAMVASDYIVKIILEGGMGMSGNPDLIQMEGGSIAEREPLDFPTRPLDLHIETDSTGNTTVNEDFSFETTWIDFTSHRIFATHDEYLSLSAEEVMALDVDISVYHEEREAVIVGVEPKPFEVYSAYYSAFLCDDDNYIYAQLRGNGNNISLDQPGAEGVSVD